MQMNIKKPTDTEKDFVKALRENYFGSKLKNDNNRAKRLTNILNRERSLTKNNNTKNLTNLLNKSR